MDEYEWDSLSNSDDGTDLADRQDHPLPANLLSTYRIITPSTLRKHQNEAVERAVDTLACKTSQASTALRHFRWNYERLLEAVAESDRDTVFARAGAATSGLAEGSGDAAACMVCMDDITPSQKICMDCGHVACQTCWLQHIQVKILEGHACDIPCMAYKVVTRLLTEHNTHMLTKYETALLNSYIEDNANARWCPSVPCCGRAVEALDDGYCEPQCDCGHRFCFKCGCQQHSPSTCSMWREWQTKLSDDSETMNYLQAHSKPCPKCNVPVEKDVRCVYLLCDSVAHTWTQIEGHTCGEWKVTADKRMEDSKAKLQRYMHYYNHYQGHMESLKKESQGGKIHDLLPDLKDYVSGLVDWSYLQQANSTLLECRRILSNAYVFAFFMFNADNFSESMTPEENARLQLLFEDSMSTLTSAVEQLSHDLTQEMTLLDAAVQFVKEPLESTSNTGTPQAKGDSGTDTGAEARRLKLINITDSIGKRILNLFNLIEKDILSMVHSDNMQISPYCPVHV